MRIKIRQSLTDWQYVVICSYLYLKTKKEFKKFERIFLAEFEQSKAIKFKVIAQKSAKEIALLVSDSLQIDVYQLALKKKTSNRVDFHFLIFIQKI